MMQWLEIDGAAYLRFNYATVASVKPRNGRYAVHIMWGGADLHGWRGSLERGKKDVDRWVEHAKGPPVMPKRRR